MARSTYIYIAMNAIGEIFRCCTVKHELQSWLEDEYNSAGVTIVERYRDNGDFSTWWSVEDFKASE